LERSNLFESHWSNQWLTYSVTETPAAPSTLNFAIPAELDSLILRTLAKNPADGPSVIEVESLLENTGGRSGIPAKSVPTRSRKAVSRRWLVGSAAAGLCGAAAYLWRSGSGPNSPIQVLLDRGEIRDPAFSPDGSRIAFSWKPPGAARFQLAVIGRGGGMPRVLGNGGVSSVGPVWSPDGKQICFAFQGFGENGLYMTALRDGTEHRVMTITAGVFGDRFDWVANSTKVVIADTWLGVPLKLIDLETGARRDLPTERMFSDTSPKSSPDGRWIAFCRNSSSTTSDLFVIATAAGSPRRLIFDGAAKRDHRWTPDGRGILFKARMGRRMGLWHVPAAGGTVREIRLPKLAAPGAFDVHARRDGSVDLVSADQFQGVSISRLEIPPEGQEPSRPVRLIASGEGEENLEANPAISPDGLRIAFVSIRSGSPEIWISDNAGEGTRQMTSFEGPEVTQPAWSPDGGYLVSASVKDGWRNLFLIDMETGAVRWLTTSGVEETEPQWSRDGRWITFASRRSGSLELWRMPAAGGAAKRLTESGGAVHRESPDGRWLYFVHDERPGLWRIPWQGGKEQLVVDRVYNEVYRAWAVGRRGVYYTYNDAAGPKWTVALLDPETRNERTLAVVDHPLPRFSGTLAVSPDERWMLVPVIEALGSRLVLLSGVKV
jgi:Tol biopolymer transport system component